MSRKVKVRVELEETDEDLSDRSIGLMRGWIVGVGLKPVEGFGRSLDKAGIDRYDLLTHPRFTSTTSHRGAVRAVGFRRRWFEDIDQV